MLMGIDPILTGHLLHRLDAMGHSDAIAVVDAHFPAERLSSRVIELPGLSTPVVLAAISTVIPLDEAPAVDLMTSADGSVLPIQEALIEAAGISQTDVRFVSRQEFYELAASAFVVVRTGETRIFGNALIRKGVVGPALEMNND